MRAWTCRRDTSASRCRLPEGGTSLELNRVRPEVGTPGGGAEVPMTRLQRAFERIPPDVAASLVLRQLQAVTRRFDQFFLAHELSALRLESLAIGQCD